MLQNIRDRITGPGAIVVIALMCIPFLFFGVNYNFIGSTYAAKVNGDEISVFEFENAYRQRLQELGDFGGELPAQLRGQLMENVLSNLIWDTVVDQYLSRENFRISDEMITTYIQSAPDFRENGEFSKDAYYAWLAERGLDPVQFEANQRIALRQGQLQRGVAATAFMTPAEYRRYLNLVREQREVAVATFDVDGIAAGIEVSDEDVQAYYDDRPDDFRSPETVDFRYVELRRDELARDVEITEQELAEYYETASARYLQDEQRQARHILILFGDDEAAAEAEATALAERARAGEPFETLARDYSDDGGTAANGGDLRMSTREQLPDGLDDAVFSMRTGEIAGPVRSEFGFHVVRLDAIQPGGPLPFEQVRGELLTELRSDKVETVWRRTERALSDALFDADSIDAIAESVGLEVKSASGFTRSGGEPFGSNQAAIDAIFDPLLLQEGRVSDVIELDANRAMAFQVTAYNEAARLPLAEVRDSIVEALRFERARAQVREQANTLEARLRDGAEFAAAAEEAGAESVSTTLIGRDSTEVDPAVRNAAFAVKKPQSGMPRIGSVRTVDGDEAVYAVMRSVPGRPEAIPVAQRDEAKRQLAAQAGQADYAALVFELERRAEVVRNREAIAANSLFE